MEVKINREIRNYTEAMFFGLSMRQFIFSACACVVAVGLYFLLKPYVGTETVSWMCILGAAPFAALGFIKYNGMTAEKFVWAWFKSEFLMPKKLTFRSTNTYYEMMKSEMEHKQKEVLRAKAKEKWQHTNAYQEYTQKNKGRSMDAEEALARGLMLIFSDFGKCKDGDPALPEAQALVKRLQAYISENYYQCTPEILQTLGAMYGAGGEFTENIDKAGGEGTAKFVERAISIYCK